jgi:hypothetical protein
VGSVFWQHPISQPASGTAVQALFLLLLMRRPKSRQPVVNCTFMLACLCKGAKFRATFSTCIYTLCIAPLLAQWGTLAGSTQNCYRSTSVHACYDHVALLSDTCKHYTTGFRGQTIQKSCNIFWNTLQSLRLLVTSKKAVTAGGCLCPDLRLLFNCSRSHTCCCSCIAWWLHCLAVRSYFARQPRQSISSQYNVLRWRVSWV